MTMKTIRYIFGILVCVTVGGGIGWQMGISQYARWNQSYADMEAVGDAVTLANVPLVKCEKVFDFGILTGTPSELKHEFEITNTGQGVLKLSEPVPESKAVWATLPKRELQPGEKVNVEVSCLPEVENSDFDYTVYIQTNAPTEPEIELMIQGELYPSVWVCDDVLEVAGVPAVSNFKVFNQVYALDKNVPLELENFRVMEAEYAEFFAFEQTPMYTYDFTNVAPPPKSGQIVTVVVKPGLPNRVFSVRVEADTNMADVPTVAFRIDFKAPELTIPGVSGVSIPLVTPVLPKEDTTAGVSEIPAEINLDAPTGE